MSELASAANREKFLLFFADRVEDLSGSNAFFRDLAASTLAAEAISTDMDTVKSRVEFGAEVLLRYHILTNLADDVSRGEHSLTEDQFNVHYSALQRAMHIRAEDV